MFVISHSSSQDENKGIAIEDPDGWLDPPPPAATYPPEHEKPPDTSKPKTQEPPLVSNLLDFIDTPAHPPTKSDVMAILSTASNVPNTVTAASLRQVKKDTTRPIKERKELSRHPCPDTTQTQTEHLLVSHGRPQSTTVSILRDRLSQTKDVGAQGRGVSGFKPRKRKRRKAATLEELADDEGDRSDGEIDPVIVDDTSDTLGTLQLVHVH